MELILQSSIITEKYKNWTMLRLLRDKKANKTANMTEIVFLRREGGGGGISEIQCLIIQNNVNSCEVYNNRHFRKVVDFAFQKLKPR